MSLLGLKQTSVLWKSQASGHPQQEKMQAGMMLTLVVELLQSFLEVVVLLSELAAQLVWKLVEYSGIVRMYSHPVVACAASGS